MCLLAQGRVAAARRGVFVVVSVRVVRWFNLVYVVGVCIVVHGVALVCTDIVLYCIRFACVLHWCALVSLESFTYL